MKHKINLLLITILVIFSTLYNNVLGQVTVPTNGINSTDYVGSSNQNHVLFKAFNTERMRIDYTNGNVGIGIASPTELLQVLGGNIDINTSTNKYMINRNPVLWHNGITSNIYVGVGAGSASVSGPGNVFVGNNAGAATTTGSKNIFIGKSAGASNIIAHYNIYIGEEAGFNNNDQGNILIGYRAGYSQTNISGSLFIGDRAGFANSTGIRNQFIGHTAGFNNTTGENNTFAGLESGLNNIDGSKNSFYGQASGLYNTSGNHNSFFGWASGALNTSGGYNSYLGSRTGENNTTGSLNTFMGYLAGVPSMVNVNNSTAIGSNATVLTDNTMILGDNAVNVGIGLSGATGGPLAKLHVERILGVATSVFFPVSIRSFNDDESALGPLTGAATGILSSTIGRNRNNIAVEGYAHNAVANYGAFFKANQASTGLNVGGLFEAQGAESVNFGVYGSAPDNTIGKFNVAVYGDAPGLPVPSPAPPPGTGSFAGYFNGDVGYTGNLWFLSDQTIKTDIVTMDNAVANSILSQINSYSYYFDTVALQNSVNVPASMQYGFMAQEIEAIAPNLVLNTITPPELDSAGNTITPPMPVKMVNYMGIIPLLVQGYKELKAENASLQEQIAACCLLSGGLRGSGPSPYPENVQRATIELENIKSFQLLQNDPNPFIESTMIRWSIPDAFNDAMIYFYDNTGTRINTYKISEKGAGELQVFGSKLSSGVYTYTLVVDGKIVDSKKMLRTK